VPSTLIGIPFSTIAANNNARQGQDNVIFTFGYSGRYGQQQGDFQPLSATFDLLVLP
jgi:hypothetical protein